ncbi:MAG: FAD-binding oxidoreductase [Thermomicrobium sp.]|nr:FAD-binding oxidoreductase [Thermomicrobium sp.]
MEARLPSEADAVVVGTCAFGLSVTAQLARLGYRRVVALDRFAVGSQTSPRAAGLFKSVQADELRTRLARMAIETVCTFERDTGVTVPFVASGSLMIARTARHAAVIDEEVEAARRWGVEVDTISPAEAVRLAPYLSAGAIVRAASVPGDIYIEEPVSLLEAYREAAERFGASVFGQVPVTKVIVSRGAVTGVETPLGTIRTETVVDAAGAWVRAVARTAGADLPIVPLRHQLAISHPLAGVAPEQPIVRIFDAAVYVRPCRGGLMWGGFEVEPLPLDPAAMGEGFSIDRVPLDFRVLEGFAAAVRDTVAVLHGAAVQEHRGGLFTMTPDGRFVVGPVPGVRGLWVLSGCNGSGFSFSPALGRVLAEWIVTGRPSIDVGPLTLARFVRAFAEEELRAAAIHQYTHYYEPVEETSERG